jgi:hypothetical protein
MKPIRALSLVLLVPAIVLAFVAVNASAPVTGSPLADGVACDLSKYRSSPGLTAATEQNVLAVTWTGQNGAELRSRFVVDAGQPTIRSLAIRKPGGQWTILGEGLTPEYRVVSGIRRLPNDQGNALRSLGVKITREVVDQNRWQAFWDAPLRVPGTPEPPGNCWPNS